MLLMTTYRAYQKKIYWGISDVWVCGYCEGKLRYVSGVTRIQVPDRRFAPPPGATDMAVSEPEYRIIRGRARCTKCGAYYRGTCPGDGYDKDYNWETISPDEYESD